MKKIDLQLFFIMAIFVFSCQQKSENNKKEQVKIQDYSEKTELTKSESIERGQYLVTIMDCNVCHTPKSMGPQGPKWIDGKMLSGYPAEQELLEENKNYTGMGILLSDDATAASGPWGVSFAANITPHETGIGTWSYAQFERSLRQGKHKGLENGRPLLPPMPWEAYATLTDEDTKAIFDYLKSIPAVDNVVPNPIMRQANP